MIAILLKSDKEEAGISLNVCLFCLFVCLIAPFCGRNLNYCYCILLKLQFKEAYKSSCLFPYSSIFKSC